MNFTTIFLLAVIMSQEIHMNDPRDYYDWVSDSEPESTAEESFLSGNVGNGTLEDEEGIVSDSGSDIDIPDLNLDNELDDDSSADDLGPTARTFTFDPPDWSEKDFVPVHPHPFLQETGPRLPEGFDTDTATPVQYFKLFFGDEMFASFAQNTNNYAKHVISKKQSTDPIYVDKKWFETDVREISAYVGLNIMFGINPMPRSRQYWSSDPYIGNEGVKRVMPSGRYEKLCEYFHVSDRDSEIPSGQPGYDQLGKVRNVISALSESFPKYLRPTEEQSIDEGMVAFTGRTKILQFMPLKPVKRGIKVWIRCNSPRGYIQQFEVYLGKESNPNPSGNGTYFDVVDGLTKTIHGVYHSLTFDNLYTSIPLLLYLHDNKIYATGTLRAGRKFVPLRVKKPGKLERGQSRICQDRKHTDLTCCVWKDTKDVRFASTKASPMLSCTTIRRIRGTYHGVNQPHMAKIYNQFMGAVDRFDRMRGSYKTGRNSHKAWKYLFWFFVDSALVNAWILYGEASTRQNPLKKKYEHINFRHEIAVELIGGFSHNNRARKRPPSYVLNSTVAKNVLWHRNVHLYNKRPRNCVYHSVLRPNGRRRCETVFGCVECGINLCKLCHHAFHEKK